VVEIPIDGVWTDITGYTYVRDEIEVTRGRANEASQVEASRCALTLNNRDGRFSPRNPLSPYYGKIGRNTPIRVRLPGDSALRLSGAGYVTTPDHASLDITGDIDLRADVTCDDWSIGAGQSMVGKYTTTGSQRSYRLVVSGAGFLILAWSENGSVLLFRTSTVAIPADAGGRIALRATLDVDNGASGHTVTFYTSDTIGGSWTQLGDPVITAGTTSIFSSSAVLEVGSITGGTVELFSGTVHAVEVRTGIAGTLVADPDFTIQDIGDTSFVDAAGRTWTLNGDAEIIPTNVRFTGEVASWPQRWDRSGNDIWVPIEAAGILRRLGQGPKPLHSALYREITSRQNIGSLPFHPTGLLAYWPCEDDEGSTSVASATGGPAMNIIGEPNFGSYSDFAASAPLPTMNDATFNGIVPKYTPTGETLVWMLVSIPDAGSATGSLMGVRTTGTANLWVIDYVSGSGGQYIVRIYDAEGTEIDNSGNIAANLDGSSFSMSLGLTQDGSDADYFVTIRKILSDGTIGTATNADTVTGRSVGRVLRVSATGDRNHTDVAVGHVMVADDTGFLVGTNDALVGWQRETAGRRIKRLCGEEGVAFAQVGDLDDTAVMGPQAMATFLALLQECAGTDLGVLYEPRDTLGLAYRTRTSMTNQTPALALDYTDGVFSQIPEPVDDDQLVRNDVTVKRPGGSSSRAVLEAGALSVQAPPDGIGTYDTTDDVNVVADGFLANQAAWRLALGTVDEARYPRLALHLHRPSFAADAALIAAAHAVDLGDRVDIDNLPDWVNHNLVSQIAQGFRERLSNFLHDIEINVSPYSPFQVAEYEAAEGGTYRYDTAGSSLTADFDAGTDTSMSVDVDIEPLWTTDGDEVPFDIECGGVRLTVTAISGSSSPQTFTITQAPVNGVVKTIPAGTPVSLWTKARYAL
jgi:hypothetical protein